MRLNSVAIFLCFSKKDLKNIDRQTNRQADKTDRQTKIDRKIYEWNIINKSTNKQPNK